MLKAIESSILIQLSLVKSIYGAHICFFLSSLRKEIKMARKSTEIECNIFNKLKLEHLKAYGPWIDSGNLTETVTRFSVRGCVFLFVLFLFFPF